ncbi:hypothetical protein [Okeania sp.]|uniref:hypothetical protein n=1 Tax=Okeania sp. TaxID=3100323 RepID=UPI002B4B92C4|nr:hypothetical protein [Okeania sp.]MEB3339503.1 hypothetical protein [Okeania sp.]
MPQITLNIPDELISRLDYFEKELPQNLELGMRELNASSTAGLKGIANLLEFLVSLPSPEEILALRPSENLQNQINILLEKNRSSELMNEDKKQWEQYQYLEHLVRIAKAQAYLKLKQKKYQI